MGWMVPAENPCRTRPTMTNSKALLETAIVVPTRNTALMIRKASFSPSALTIQALSSWLATMVAMKAVAIHWARSCPMPYAPITLGMATLTIVADNTIATAPVIPAMVMYHR